jgi:hypothetical protein
MGCKPPTDGGQHDLPVVRACQGPLALMFSTHLLAPLGVRLQLPSKDTSVEVNQFAGDVA